MTQAPETPPSRSHSPSLPLRLLRACGQILRNAVSTSLDLYKVMIPIIIGVKILSDLDLIRYLALPLEPFMGLVGLPGEMGLVWATSLVVNIYSGIIVYVSMAPTMEPLSVAQISVLAAIILVAHSLPVECKIAQRCGVSLRSQVIFRMASAMMLGIILHLVYSGFGLLQQPSEILWRPEQPAPGLLNWAMSQARNLLYLFWIILALMAFMRLLDQFRITEWINNKLTPFLRFMGIGKNAATITVLGLTMGITYGGGLIIHEVKSGRVSQRDVFASLTLMGLSHALIEDTLLMMLLGAHVSATLWGRLLFSLVFVAVFMRVFDRYRRNRLPAGDAAADQQA